MKLDCIILADDLTGACDAGVAFAAHGHHVEVWTSADSPYPTEGSLPARTEVLALNTASRDRSTAAATASLSDSLAWARLQRPTVVFKKIDSLLRGNTLEEIATVLNHFPDHLLVLAPAFPRNGRTMKNGCIEVNNRPWQTVDLHSELTKRGLSPELIPTGNPVYALPAAIESGAAFLLCDADSDEDLDAIVQTILPLDRQVGWIGSAGLAEALARAGDSRPQNLNTVHLPMPIVFCIGSTDRVTRGQLEHLLRDKSITELSPESATREQLMAARASNTAILLSIRHPETSAASILEVFSLLDAEDYTLLLSGGETAMLVCRAIGARGIILERELLPGIPCGALRGGVADGMRVITKSGAFGNPETLTYLQNMITNNETAISHA